MVSRYGGQFRSKALTERSHNSRVCRIVADRDGRGLHVVLPNESLQPPSAGSILMSARSAARGVEGLSLIDIPPAAELRR
jgi:hypothetical protein